MSEDIQVENTAKRITGEGELDLFAAGLRIASRWRFILCGVAIGSALGILLALIIKPEYKADASIIIPTRMSGSASAMVVAQLAGIGGGLDLIGGGNEIYIDMMRSRTVADHLIQRFNLDKVFKTNDAEKLRRALTSVSKFEAQPEGLVRVTVQTTSPQLSTDLANGYVDEMELLDHTMAMNSASSRRVYFERALLAEKNELVDAEVALRQAAEKTSGVVPTDQSLIEVRSIEAVRVQLAARQVDLAVLLQSAASGNPQVLRLQSEINGLESQLHQLEMGENSHGIVSTSKLPEAQLVYVRALREVKYHEQLYQMLSQQVDKARMDESNSVPVVQIMDRAAVPLHKSWPPRTLMALAGFLGGGILAMIWIFIEQFVRRGLDDGDYGVRYRELLFQAAKGRR